MAGLALSTSALLHRLESAWNAQSSAHRCRHAWSHQDAFDFRFPPFNELVQGDGPPGPSQGQVPEPDGQVLTPPAAPRLERPRVKAAL